MELISSAFLGFIQGLTEFLPISSSGHMEIVSSIFDLSKPDITFDVFVHFGSLFAILLFFKFNYSQSVANDLEINKYKKIIALSFIPYAKTAGFEHKDLRSPCLIPSTI